MENKCIELLTSCNILIFKIKLSNLITYLKEKEKEKALTWNNFWTPVLSNIFWQKTWFLIIVMQRYQKLKNLNIILSAKCYKMISS